MEKKSYMVGEGFSEEAHWNRDTKEQADRHNREGRRENR